MSLILFDFSQANVLSKVYSLGKLACIVSDVWQAIMSTKEKPLSEVLSLPAMMMYSMSIFLFCFVVIALLTCKISGDCLLTESAALWQIYIFYVFCQVNTIISFPKKNTLMNSSLMFTLVFLWCSKMYRFDNQSWNKSTSFL